MAKFRILLLSTASIGVALALHDSAAAEASGAQMAAGATIDEVVVTGSLIARKDYVADSPIVTMGKDALQSAGPTTLNAVLNRMPQFVASDPGTSYGGSGRGARANINLRGLGIARTLVLLDGKRLEPSDPLGTIDLNSIPNEVISNVEIITGGASTAYGSDAIAGVVNLKLNHNFKGLSLDAQYGATGLGDAQNYALSATAGSTFADDKGSALLSVSYLNRDYSPRGNRPFFAYSFPATALYEGVLQPTATNLPTTAALNAVFKAKYGLTTAPTLAQGLAVNPDGTLFTPSAPVINNRYSANDPNNVLIGGAVSTPYGRTLPVQQPLERYTAFGHLDYNLTDSLQSYLQLQMAHSDSSFPVPGYAIRTPTIAYNNVFLPADLTAIMASRPNPTAPISYNVASGKFGPEIAGSVYDLFQVTTGLKGKGPRDWTWEVYGSYGRTNDIETDSNQVNAVALQSLLSASDGGASICAGGFNPFNTTQLSVASPACYNYVHRTTTSQTTLDQVVLEASVQGKLMDLPAGELRFAAGVDYRRNGYVSNPDSQLINATVLTTTVNSVKPIDASVDVKEIYGELLVPLLRDVPFVKEATLDLGFRTSDYSSIGSVSAYKATGNWRVTDWLGFRGGYQRAIRAPSLGELYPNPGGQGGLIGSTASGAGDPCDVAGSLRNAALNPNAAKVTALCIASGVPANLVNIFRFNGSSVTASTPFSTGLTAETADTYTAGLVFQSKFKNPLLERLSISADYYNIDVKNAIGFITAGVALNQCFNSNGTSNPNYDPSSPYCKLILRDGAGNITQVNTPQLNLASYKTSGVDLQLDDAFDLSALNLPEGWGELRLNVVATYLLGYEIQNLLGQPFIDYAGTIGNGQIDAFSISDPKWKVSASATVTHGPVEVTLASRYISSMYNSLDAGSPTHSRAGTASIVYFDLTGRLQLPWETTLRAGVLNLGDTYPPNWTGLGATDAALFDILGRRFFVGVNKRF